MDPPASSDAIRNPATLFNQKDQVRRSIIKAYWAIILLTVPLWWYTTSIERLSLPSRRIQQLAHKHLKLPISICLETTEPSLVDQIQYELSIRKLQNPAQWKGLEVSVMGRVNCGEMNGYGVYIVKPSKEAHTSVQRRNLTVPSSTSAYTLVDTLSTLVFPYSTPSDPEHRVVQYSPHYRLAFSLLNEDAVAGGAIMDWSIKDALAEYINPIIHSLSALHNFTIESQVQYHAPLAFATLPLDQFYGITPSDLTVFINSAEWTLSSSSSNDPVIHFVLFVPSSERRPLHILTHDNLPSPASAFLLPQWGGIVIHNPSQHSVATNQLSPEETHAVFSSFASQLLSLLGVAALPKEVSSNSSLDGGYVLSEWQLDALTRRRTLENSQASQDTLSSIVKLVDQIENMPLGEDVKDDVEGALDALNKMYDAAGSSLSDAFTYSTRSFVLASRAFFNPGMLALLYFPIEHTYAVYTPLFASALTPLAVAALREFLLWKRQRNVQAPVGP